ncbi:MAG: LAGLIDADG family homing endonuclease [Candidatus Hermodarchaeota archaeon]
MEAINRFKEFFQEFTDENGERIYMKKIQLMISEGHRSLTVNFKNILHFDPELGRQLRETNSARTLRAAERALVDLVHLEDPEYSDKLHVRPYNIHGEQKHTLRSLRAEHLGTLISIDAIVTGATQVKPLLTLGMFKCRNCDTNMRRMQIDGKYNPPYLCENPECGRKGPFQLIQEQSEFIDWQKLIIQEKPEDLLPGQLPVSFTAILQDDIVDTIRPGDRVAIVGILQSRPESQLKAGTTATYFKYIDVLYADRETGEFEKIQITEEDVEKIMELSKDPFIVNKIVQSIAPSIWGNDSVKEAIALLLFGGAPKEGIEGMKLRSESNVFLIGDPGTAKSQLLKYVSTIAPRGLFTSGRGSSAAGLTAAVMRDSESGEMALEAGALVLADRGIACMSGDTKILTSKGSIKIEDLFNQSESKCSQQIIDDILILDCSKEFHQVFGLMNYKIQPNKIIKIIKKPIKDRKLYKLTNELGFPIKLTEDHLIPVWKNNSVIWEKVENLDKNSIIIFPRNPPFLNKVPYIIDLIDPELFVLMSDELANLLKYEIADKFGSVTNGSKILEVPRWIFSGNSKRNSIKIKYLKKIIRDCQLESENIYPMITRFHAGASSAEFKLPLKLSPDLCEIAGLILSDGSIAQKKTISFYNNDASLLTHFKDLCKEVGVKCAEYDYSHEYEATIRGKKFTSKRSPTRVIHSKVISSILHNLGIPYGEKSKDNSMHFSVIETLPEKHLSAFIRGWFDGDGGISKRKTIRNGREDTTYLLHFTSGIKGNLEHLQALLLKFGIRSYINKSTGGSQNLIITKKSNWVKFQKKVGSRCKNKASRLEEILESRDFGDQIPDVGTKLKELRKNKLKIGRTSVKSVSSSSLYYYEENESPIPRTVLRDLLKEYKTLGLNFSFLEKILHSDIIFVKLDKKEELPQESWVYDLTLENVLEEPNFIANNWFIHNCIDEFDKMRPDDRDAIHEAMEQHTVSIAKAGIVATLNSRTSILAAANPKYGRWDPMKDPRTQLNMPPTVLSRFDLIFVMADEPNPEADEKLSSHILNLHRDSVLDKEPPIPRELLTKYIAYARQRCNPVLSDEALEIIKQFYLSLRSKSVATTGGAEGRRRMVNPIAITARQLESLVRLAEARAKMALSNTVTARDASAAVKLMEVTMKQIAMDEETGTFDADRWIGGVSTKTRSRTEMIDDLIDLVERNLPDDQKGRGVAIDDIIRVGKDQDIDEDMINAAIEQLLRDGLLFKPREGYVKRI